ncbi:MAG: hypothetical protein JOY92_04910 [Verrucomicrobia bacterium]|nr:hypothetical protein [Verrucomicrobiota bacterium]
MPHGEESLPNDEQLCRYQRCALSPEELLTLSDYFASRPERRPAETDRDGRFSPSDWLWSEALKFLAGYDDLVAKLDGVADPVQDEILEARLANDPLSANYLEDLAAFRKEMDAMPEVTYGPVDNWA